jgi:membrane protease YdiL (CAAX protease family)
MSDGPPAAAQVTGPAGTDVTAGIRRLPVWGFVVIAAVYLLIVQGLSKLLTAGLHTTYAAPASVNELWRSITVPVLVSLVFVYAVVGVLGWWRPVFTDDRPVRRWVWVIPAIIAVTALAGMNYPGLGQRGAGFTVLFAVSMLGVGFAEEGMFRGLGVVTFRANGFTEAKVALWTCVLFGLAHATNLFSEGPKALIQVLVTAAAGYFFYLTRRVSGGLVVPAVVHGLWDFGAISASVVPGRIYLGAGLFILADIVMVILLLIRRRHIEPARPAASG